MHCRRLGNIPCLTLLYARSTYPSSRQPDNQNSLQALPFIPWGGAAMERNSVALLRTSGVLIGT